MVGELTDLRRVAPWSADRIGVPVLALCGEHGREHHREGTRALVAMLPDAEQRSVGGAHHFGPNTHPDEVAVLVQEFVARVTPDRHRAPSE